MFDDDRVAAMACIWQGAQQSFQQQREANEKQQSKKRPGKPLQVGDSVTVLVEGQRPNFRPRWDARWQVIRARDPVYWVRHLPTGHERVLNWEKLHWVPPDVDWSMIPTNVTEVTKDSPTKPQFEMPAPKPMDYDELPPSTKSPSASETSSHQQSVESQPTSLFWQESDLQPNSDHLSMGSGRQREELRSPSPTSTSADSAGDPAAFGDSATPGHR